MTKLFILSALFTLSVIFFSCGDETPVNEKPTENTNSDGSTGNAEKDENSNTTAEIILENNIIDFGMNEDESEISFTSKKDWSLNVKIESYDEWCSVTPNNGKAGENTIKVRVTENPYIENRKAIVEIKSEKVSKEVTITQKGKSAIIISQNNIEVNSDKNTIEIDISSNIEFKQEIQADWIKETTSNTEKSLINEKRIYQIDANTTNSNRIGHIVFIGDNDIKETLTITQKKSNEKRIVKYINTSNEEDEIIGELTFTNNKLSKFEIYNNNPTIEYIIQQTISYNDDEVTITGRVNDLNCTQTYYLNNSGLASRCFTHFQNANYGETFRTYFDYSEEGTLKGYNTYDTTKPVECFFIYQGNKINYIEKRFKRYSTYGLNYSDNIETFMYKLEYTNNIENKSKILTPLHEKALFEYLAAYYAGLLGKPTEYLPDSYTDYYGTGTFEYEINDIGYITKITQTKGSVTSTYLFEYQEIE